MIEGAVVFNGLTMNVPAFTHHTILGDKKPGAWASPYYWYRIMAIDGLWSDPINFEVVQLPFQDKTFSGDRYTGGKTIVLTGRVEAKTLAYLRAGQKALRAAFIPTAQALGSTSDLTFYLGSDHLKLKAGWMNQQLQMPEAQADLTWRRAFTVQLYFDDPTVYTSGGGSYTGWV